MSNESNPTVEERRAKLLEALPQYAELINTLPPPEEITEPCRRCGGSGQYSFNMMHGTMCYGCSGSGRQLNAKQARKRSDLLRPKLELRDVRAAGEIYKHNGMPFLAYEVVWATKGGVRIRVRSLNLMSWKGRKTYMLGSAHTIVVDGVTHRYAGHALPDELPEAWRGQPVLPEHLAELQAALPEGATLAWSLE